MELGILKHVLPQERSLASSGNTQAGSEETDLRTVAPAHRRDFCPIITEDHNYEGKKGMRNREMGILEM